MRCPFCQHPNAQVADSQWLGDTNSIRHRRKRLKCGQRFSTFKTAEIRMPQVVKSNGTRVPPNPHRLQASLERALHERPITQEQIDETVALTGQRLCHLSKKEIASRIVDEMAMEELAKIDQVAYVRLASVYKSFKDVSEFTRVVTECKAK